MTIYSVSLDLNGTLIPQFRKLKYISILTINKNILKDIYIQKLLKYWSISKFQDVELIARQIARSIAPQTKNMKKKKKPLCNIYILGSVK